MHNEQQQPKLFYHSVTTRQSQTNAKGTPRNRNKKAAFSYFCLGMKPASPCFSMVYLLKKYRLDFLDFVLWYVVFNTYLPHHWLLPSTSLLLLIFLKYSVTQICLEKYKLSVLMGDGVGEGEERGIGKNILDARTRGLALALASCSHEQNRESKRLNRLFVLTG
uniref:Uncharacterized protein n=1 Tax=Strigamia maritima TaxID=126957 RepID=T1JKB3_STRMM